MKYFFGLLVFAILQLFTVCAEETFAKVTFLKGDVFAFTDGQADNKTKLEKGSLLAENTNIETAAQSVCRIQLDDGSVITLSPVSTIRLNKMPKNEPGFIALVKGEIRSSVTKQSSGKDYKLFVKTNTATLGVRGTEFLTVYNEVNHITSTVAFGGEVQISNLATDTSKSAFKKQVEVVDKNYARNFAEVLSDDRTKSIFRGEFSGSFPGYREAIVPVQISKKQFQALERRDEVAMSTEIDHVSHKQSSSSSTEEKNDSLIPQPRERYQDTNYPAEVLVPANGYLDLKTGIYISPPKNAEEVPEDFGKVDENTGDYIPPLGLFLHPLKGFMILEDGINKLAEGTKERLQQLGGMMVTGAGALADGATAVGGAVVSGVTAVGGVAVDGVTTVAKGTAKGAVIVGGAVVDGVSTVGGMAVNGVTAVGGAVVDGATAVGGAAVDGVSAVGGAVKNGFTAVSDHAAYRLNQLGGLMDTMNASIASGLIYWKEATKLDSKLRPQYYYDSNFYDEVYGQIENISRQSSMIFEFDAFVAHRSYDTETWLIYPKGSFHNVTHFKTGGGLLRRQDYAEWDGGVEINHRHLDLGRPARTIIDVGFHVRNQDLFGLENSKWSYRWVNKDLHILIGEEFKTHFKHSTRTSIKLTEYQMISGEKGNIWSLHLLHGSDFGRNHTIESGANLANNRSSLSKKTNTAEGFLSHIGHNYWIFPCELTSTLRIRATDWTDHTAERGTEWLIVPRFEFGRIYTPFLNYALFYQYEKNLSKEKATHDFTKHQFGGHLIIYF